MHTESAFLRRLTTYSVLSSDDVCLIGSACRRMRAVSKHELLCRTGLVPSHAIVLLEGLACRFNQYASKQRQITSFLLPGDGCNLIVQPLRMVDAVAALTDCEVAEIPNDVLAQLWERPSIASALRISAAVEDATLRTWLFNIGKRRATDRFVHLMLKLHHRLLTIGRAEPQAFEFPISQSDCADALGLSLVHMNKSYQQVRRSGAIEWRHGVVSISNVDALRAQYEVDLSYLSPSELEQPEMAQLVV